MDRKKEVIKRINLKKGRGLELGPLYSPVVTKDEARIFYIDHMSTEDLRKKYKGHPFSVDEIVPVDYVVGGTNLKKLLGNKKFDYVIAAHVIEHIPDVVSWLKDVASVLNKGGILSLVIPDKRYSFDISRNVSSPSDVIGSYLDKLTKANSAMVYDSAAEYREITPAQAWSGNFKHALVEPSDWNMSEGLRRAKLSLRPNEYVDSHCYVFTPYSFFEVLKRLIHHELLDFEVIYFAETKLDELEFYVSLRKIDTKKVSKKTQLRKIPALKRPLQQEEAEIQITKLKQLLKEAKLELSLMTSSKSWKITKPLRNFSRLVKKK